MLVLYRHDAVENIGLMTFLTRPSLFSRAGSVFLTSFIRLDTSVSQFLFLSAFFSTLIGINLLVKSKAFQYIMCKCKH